MLWGLDGGILAILAVGIPYILTFYFLLALLEDSGYLNAAAFLTDRVMHRFGLHGRAVIPLIAAGGCNVPAIIATRSLTSMRERAIAATLITLTPCSARTAVILGAVAAFAGWQWALFVYGVVFVVGVVGRAGAQPPAARAEGRPRHGDVPLPPARCCARWRARPGAASASSSGTRRRSSSPAASSWAPSTRPGSSGSSPRRWRRSSRAGCCCPAVAGLTLLFAVLRKELALQLLIAFAAVSVGGAVADISEHS